MKKINLEKIIEAKKLDTKEVALELFPNALHPVLALKRILSGEGVLDADQISRFSLFSGIPISELYEGGKWFAKIQGKKHILVSGRYRAELDTDTWTTELYHKDSLFHEFIIHSKSISLCDYIARLDAEISKNS